MLTYFLATSSLYLDYDNETAAGVNSVELDLGSLDVGQEVCIVTSIINILNNRLYRYNILIKIRSAMLDVGDFTRAIIGFPTGVITLPALPRAK